MPNYMYFPITDVSGFVVCVAVVEYRFEVLDALL